MSSLELNRACKGFACIGREPVNAPKELQAIFQEEYDMTSSHRTRHKNKMQCEFAYINYVNEGSGIDDFLRRPSR